MLDIENTKRNIVVAMSGGVDSSVVACALSRMGHNVTGITLQLYDSGKFAGKKGACCAGQDIYDAQMVAQKFGFPHYVLNYESLFSQAVIDDFADTYLQGRTPIPCVRCNQKVKFQDLFKVAKDLGADCLATGHYVRRIVNNSKAELHMAIDPGKDQSYFLFATTQEQLDFLRFPLGNMHKTQTRQLAEDLGLSVSDKPDSQDICFVPNKDYRSIVTKLRPDALKKGNIIDHQGNIIAEHDSIINFTIGQRRGIGIASKEPLYVIKINPTTNEVMVGPKEMLQSQDVFINNLNWLADPLNNKMQMKCKVKLRSMHEPINATVYYNHLNFDQMHVILDEPYNGVTPGQACVLYDGTRVLGGGWIIQKE